MTFPEPPLDPQELPAWVRNYLKPSALGRPAYKAHQFTINGVTYLFVRDFHFAAVPHPIDRNYSMLAGLYLTRHIHRGIT